MTKARFIPEKFTFNICITKRPDKGPMVKFRIYDVTDRTANNYYAHITQSISQEIKAIKQ